VLTCPDMQSDGALYVAAFDCSQWYIVCRSGSVVYADRCPEGTRFQLDQRTCLDEALCRSGRRSADRDPRQIKFILVDHGDDDDDDGDSRRRVARRQIKFRSLGYDTDATGIVRRQIKFRSLPVQSAIPAGGPPYDGRSRERRQIKFRSLLERAIEPKKHDEERERRQVKFDALSTNSADRSSMTYTANVNHLPLYWYRRR